MMGIPALLAAGAIFAAGPGLAGEVPAGGVKLTAGQAWHTCRARDWAARPGGYMIYNDQFTGAPGKACIRSDGLNLTVTTSARPASMGVTDSPMIGYGEYFGYRDAQSGLPLPVWWLEHTVWTRHFSCTGAASGTWICDAFDAFFSPTLASGGQHGNRELVVMTRTSSGAAGPGSLVRVSGHWWRFWDWRTCPPAVGICWPIMRFAEVHQTARSQRLRLPAFLRWLTAHGYLASSEYMDNDPARPEIWSGGRGLRIGLGRGDIIRLPAVIRGQP